MKSTAVFIFSLIVFAPSITATTGDVSLMVRGGVGVHLTVDNFNDHNITINFSINWTDIFGKQVNTDEGYAELETRRSWEYGDIPVIPFFQRISVYLEADGIVVEKQGFSFFVLVFLR